MAEVLYKIVAINSDFKNALPHRVRTVLDNDISGVTYYSYDYKKRRYISCFINDNFDIYDRLVEKDKEIEKLAGVIEEQERHIKEANYEIKRLNNIINELEKIIINKEKEFSKPVYISSQTLLNKIKELKGE